MKYLEAKRLREQAAGKEEENKMQDGSRSDQQTGVAPDVLAKQIGVKFEDIKGTGENGAVTNKDVRNHARKVRDANQANPPISSPRPPK